MKMNEITFSQVIREKSELKRLTHRLQKELTILTRRDISLKIAIFRSLPEDALRKAVGDDIFNAISSEVRSIQVNPPKKSIHRKK